MPFKYGDGAYFSAEVARLEKDYEKVEQLCKRSFTYRAKFIIKALSLVASIPDKELSKRIEYEEYMLRIINALLSGGDYMPLQQVYQKLRLLSGLIKSHISIGNISRASE